MTKKQNSPSTENDDSESGGKVANDTNKTGDQKATQKNEGRRTPDSRHDREAHIGGSNQSQSRQGKAGGGH